MHSHSFLRCFFLSLVIVVSVIDSHDLFNMFNEVKDQVGEKIERVSTKVKEKVQEKVATLKDTQTCPATHTTEYRTVLGVYRHLVREWLDKFPTRNAEKYRFLIELSPSEFQRLEKFASSADYDQRKALTETHAISEILKRMVYQVEEDRPIDLTLSWSAWMRSFNINTIIKTILFTAAAGVISFISIRTHFRRGRWLSAFFIVVFVVSVMQNWYTLYLEAQAKVDEVLMKKLPKHCQGHSMGFFDMVKAKVGRVFQLPVDDCFEYHKALRATPHSQVTPVQAFSMTFAQLFVTPLGTIGESISQFFAGTMKHVPMIIWPVILVIIIFVIIIVLLTYLRYEVHLPFMMGSIRPSPHAAISSAQTNVIEQLESSTNSTNQMKYLENRIVELEKQLEQQNKPALEDKPKSSESVTSTTRERSPSSPPPLGFRPEFTT